MFFLFKIKHIIQEISLLLENIDRDNLIHIRYLFKINFSWLSSLPQRVVLQLFHPTLELWIYTKEQSPLIICFQSFENSAFSTK